jgi:hypothetical protein
MQLPCYLAQILKVYHSVDKHWFGTFSKSFFFTVFFFVGMPAKYSSFSWSKRNLFLAILFTVAISVFIN